MAPEVPAVRLLRPRGPEGHDAKGVYDMRMSRVNITVPDEVIVRAKAAGLNVSRVATSALVEELDRRSKIDALDAYLAELERELGPVSAEEGAAAAAWVDGVVSGSVARTASRRHSA